jgi:hypothetical protein
MPIPLSPAPKTAVAMLAALLWASTCASAADEGAASAGPKKELAPKGSEFQLFIENDFLAGTDRYYTNGIKLGFGVPVEAVRQFLEVPSRWILDRFSNRAAQLHYGLFVGQSMYTPRSITVREPQPFDRPWAAWLYLGGVVQRVEGNRLDTVEIDVGAVGPAALGKEVQTRWHELVGAPRPLGWHNQIPNEPAFLVTYLHKQKHDFGTDYVEWIPHLGATLGTVMTLARAGGTVRAGRNMTGFGVNSIEPGGTLLQNTRRQHEGRARKDVEWYGFLGADFRLVGRNIFLDGTLLRDSPRVDSRDVVYDWTVGLSARYQVVRVSLTRLRRSAEFTTPPGSGGKQTFYSLNVGLEF